MFVKPSSETPGRPFQFDPHELAAERVSHLYRRRHVALAFNAVGGALVAGVLAMDLHVWGLAWYLVFLAVHGWHWYQGREREGDGAKGIVQSRGALDTHVLAAALAGLGWGSICALTPWLSPTDAPVLLVVVVLAAVVAMPRLATVPMVYGAYAAGVLVPQFAAAMLWPVLDRGMVAALLVMVPCVLWASAWAVHADLMEVILQRMALERMAGEDKLTSLPNRRRFDSVFEAEWRRALRLRAPISLMLLDIDHFKKYNDLYGHTAGDECLARVGEALGAQIKRAGDLVARYGGEEFVVILFHAPVADARVIAERMCRTVQALQLPHQDSPHRVVTVSIGGATVVPTEEMAAKVLLDQADQALYEAKKIGRNQVHWSHSLLLPGASSDAEPIQSA